MLSQKRMHLVVPLLRRTRSIQCSILVSNQAVAKLMCYVTIVLETNVS